MIHENRSITQSEKVGLKKKEKKNVNEKYQE